MVMDVSNGGSKEAAKAMVSDHFHRLQDANEIAPAPGETVDVMLFQIAKLELRPGDVLIVRVSDELMRWEGPARIIQSDRPYVPLMDRIGQKIGAVLPPSVKVLVIGKHLELTLLTREEQEHARDAPGHDRIIELP
jgi:hypothetical protein